jgi:hypothetical protein
MSDIFISYNNEDRPRAQKFAEALAGRGWSVFWDRKIPTGRTWRETIGKELNGARCVIVLWSKTSVVSDWVREEADDAKQRGVLVPVQIDNIPPPIGFRGIQTADFVNWNAAETTLAFDGLAADIAALIGVPPKEPKKGQDRRADTDARRETQKEVGIGPNSLQPIVVEEKRPSAGGELAASQSCADAKKPGDQLASSEPTGKSEPGIVVRIVIFFIMIAMFLAIVVLLFGR